MIRSTFARLVAAPLAWMALLALPAMAELKIQEVTSPGGLKAWLSENHNIPFVAIELRFQGGTSLDLPGKRGAVNLMTGLLEEGTGDLDSQGFAAARDGLAAQFSFSANSDSLAVSAMMLTENRDAAVDLLAGALRAPRFDQDALDRVREQVLSGLRSDAKDPGEIAMRAASAMAFGDHPYATSGKGTPESVAALTRDDMLAAHRAVLVRDRVYISAAGDISPQELSLLLDRLLGDLPKAETALPGEAPWHLTPGVSVIDYPSPQSVVYFGHRGIKLDDPDFFAAYILNEVVGGGRFSARLMTEVRDKRGLTYGIDSSLWVMDHAEMLMGQFAASNDKVAEAITVIRDEWARVAREGITPAELEKTKTYLTGAYPLRFSGNGPIASILVGMQMDGYPADYPNTRNARVNAVTLADVQRVAARLFQPDQLRFVVVGQPVGVTPTP